MAKLTDTQLIILSKAAASDDGVAAIPDKMTKATAVKVAASLVARKLMREVLAKEVMPSWRQDEKGRGVALIITRAGRDAIVVEDEAEQSSEIEISDQNAEQEKLGASETKPSANPIAAAVQKPPRAGSKQAQLIAMLSAEEGATINALIDATGWLPHTTRAALTGLRQRGFQIERQQAEGDKPSIYRIVSTAA